MRFTSFIALSGLWSLVSSHHPVHLTMRASPLALKLESIGNTEVRATLTNRGATDLKLLTMGTFLDSNPVEKVSVHTAEARVPFQGIRFNIMRAGLPAEAFTFVRANQSVQVEFDVAELHDISDGGTYTFRAQGAFPYALNNATDLEDDAIPYRSNAVTVDVDGVEAARVGLAVDKLKARTALATDCTGEERAATLKGLENCAKIANTAADAAESGSAAKFREYFKTTSATTRQSVATKLRAVAAECSASTKGETSYHCIDALGACQPGVLAYTLPARDFIVNCPLFFSDLPALTNRCHGQDQATTVLHEMTHAPGVFGDGTEDHGYGYRAVTALSRADALDNADSYTLFANAIISNC